jgi:hypothetical protein
MRSVSIAPRGCATTQGASRGACLACEAVVSKAKDRADLSLCRALGREEAQVPEIER